MKDKSDFQQVKAEYVNNYDKRISKVIHNQFAHTPLLWFLKRLEIFNNNYTRINQIKTSTFIHTTIQKNNTNNY